MAWTFYNSNGEALVQHAESEATQAEMEAETAGAKFVPPDLVKYSPGVAKAWVRMNQDGSIVGSTSYPNSYNINGTSGDGSGDNTVTWEVDFSQVTYAVVSTTADAGEYNSSAGTFATGSVQIYNVTSSSGSAGAFRNSVVAYGDQ